MTQGQKTNTYLCATTQTMTNKSPKSIMMWDIFWSINHMYWYWHFVFARLDLEANPLSSKWVMCLPSYVADGFTLVSPVVCLLCSSLELTLSHMDANWAVRRVRTPVLQLHVIFWATVTVKWTASIQKCVLYSWRAARDCKMWLSQMLCWAFSLCLTWLNVPC